MSYLDLGYDSFLDRSESFYAPGQTELQTENLIQDLSVRKLVPDGSIISQNKKLSIDFVKGIIEGEVDGANVSIGGDEVFSLTDAQGNVIVDKTGIVSSSVFESDSVVTLAKTRTTSSVDFVDVPGTTINIVIKKEANVLFLLYGDFANYPSDGGIASEYVGLDIDGKLYPDSLNGFGNVFYCADVPGSDLTVVLATFHGHFLTTLGVGNHTAKLKYRKQGVATVDARVTNTGLTYIILGK